MTSSQTWSRHWHRPEAGDGIASIMTRVAVIGAGPAGLVSAREALRAGCDVTVFETGTDVGGVWVYSEAVEDDPLGKVSTQTVHSSLYDSLTTNIPRDLMAYSDFTFDSAGGGQDDWPRFPHHTCVRQYLDRFADHFDIRRHVSFNDAVTDIKRKAKSWLVKSERGVSEFDAVMVCNGHYAKPRVPSLPGVEHFGGLQTHAHNYRSPEGLAGKRVLIWGTSASGLDISAEVATVAEHVYWCGNVFEQETAMGPNRSGHPSPTRVTADGAIVAGDEVLQAEVLLYCTGYHYTFPFLNEALVTVDDNWVQGLYRDIVAPDNPTIGFIGIPFLIIPFPIFEMQARWFVHHLTGLQVLPPAAEMKAADKARVARLEQAGTRKRHYHRLGDEQVAYYNELAAECDAAPMPAWFIETWKAVGEARAAHGVQYKSVDLPVLGPTRIVSAGGVSPA